MKRTALLAIDQGTTSSRALVFSTTGEVLFSAQKELRLHLPQSGWVEQNPDDILNDTIEVTRNVIHEAMKAGYTVAAAGITNQRETTIIWDRKTGKPVYNAIVWQDRRTAEYCADLRQQGHEQLITGKTGLLLDPYFSATKIRWILESDPSIRKRAQASELAVGTVDCFLLWHLTGGKVHATDITNASRTMLYNMHEKKWDGQLLALFGIPAGLLPEVRDNSDFFGTTDQDILGTSLTIGGMAGDQQAALIGQSCFSPGDIKATYGTGCFVLMNIGTMARPSSHRLLVTPAYSVGGNTVYALEGSIFNAGTAVKWLRESAGMIASSAETETLARSVPDNGGVYFVPAFTGLGAPYWNPDARGMIAGLGRETGKAHIARAALEAQGYQTKDLIAAMESDGGIKISSIRADGGLSANTFMCQFLSDMLNAEVEIPQTTEATAWGAACLAGLHAGIFSALEETEKVRSTGKRFSPSMTAQTRDNLYRGWRKTLEAVLSL